MTKQKKSNIFTIKMPKEVKENRYILRKYIRTLSVAHNLKSYEEKELKKAISFFVILHNMLRVEDIYYDQVMMQNKQLNKLLNLIYCTKVYSILGAFYKMYNKGSKIRGNLEGITKIEEVNLEIKLNKHFYKKLLL